MGVVRSVYHWLVRAALVAATALICFNSAAADAVARSPDLGIRPIRIDRGRLRGCLLLHGWLSTPLDFGDLPRALDEAGWDVHVPLHPGHGRRPADMAGVTGEQLLASARDHYRDMRARYGDVALIGFSMGGTIAMILASEEPPERMVLVAPFCDVCHKWYYGLRAQTWWRLLSPFVQYVVRPPGLTRLNRPDGRDRIVAYRAYPATALGALMEIRRRARTDVVPGTLAMPVLLVHSSADETCSWTAARRVVAQMPRAVLPEAGFHRSNHHLLHDHERAEAVAEIVRFLSARETP